MAKIVVVVVVGEVDARRTIRAALPPEFELTYADDGADALALVASRHVDIVIVDPKAGHVGSDVSGTSATMAVKRAAGDRFVPVLLLTASNDESHLSACLQSGADEIIFKPLSAVLLESKIRSLLRARDLLEASGRQTRELGRYRGQVEAENKIARKVFESITRGQIVNLPGVATRSFAMGTFSGDLVLMHTMEDGRLRMLLGDFSGHGLSAAIGAIPVSDVFYAMCRRDLPVARILVELNAKIHRMMPRNIFLSACIAELDIEGLELSVYNAGLPDVLLVSRGGRISKRVRSNHVPLGVLPADKFAVSLQRVEVEQDDRILLCSDGVLETLNPENLFLGEEGFNRLVERAKEASWLESIVDQLDDFRKDAGRTDDVTLMAIHCGTSLRNALLADRKSLERTELAVDVRYGSEALRDEVGLEPFVHALESYASLSRHSGELYTVMSELFSNALEHGILRLDSSEKADAAGFLRYYQARKRQLGCLKAGEIRMSLRVTTRLGHRIARVRVEDSGPGMDPQNRVRVSPDEGTLAGRGLAMVRSLCQRLTFSDGGAVAEADYLLEGDAGHFPLIGKGDSSDSYPAAQPVDLLRT